MEILYHGHSCIQVTSGGNSIIIDPFISGNELAETDVSNINVNYVLLTHGHEDHILDADYIAKNNSAPVICNVELSAYMGSKGVTVEPMNIGGQVEFPFFTVKMIRAIHSSSITLENGESLYLGTPAGFIIEIGGKTILHAGDTSLFNDMKLIGDKYDIDIAFLPIGDRFTMGIEDAVQATDWLNAKRVVPIHYNTFPFIKQDPFEFARKIDNIGKECMVLEIGKSYVLE